MRPASSSSARNGGAFAALITIPRQAGTGSVNYTDTTVTVGNSYGYQVAAVNATVQSGGRNIATVNTLPSAPTSLSALALAGLQIQLTWTDNANNETGFVIERAVNGGAFVVLITVAPLGGTGSVSYTDMGLTAGDTYDYQVSAVTQLARLRTRTSQARPPYRKLKQKNLADFQNLPG